MIQSFSDPWWEPKLETWYFLSTKSPTDLNSNNLSTASSTTDELVCYPASLSTSWMSHWMAQIIYGFCYIYAPKKGRRYTYVYWD